LSDTRTDSRISRRQILIGGTAAGALLVACGPSPAAAPTQVAQTSPVAQPTRAETMAVAIPSVTVAKPTAPAVSVEGYPISGQVFTTVQRTIVPVAIPSTSPEIYPRQVAVYERYGYGKWQEGAGAAIKKMLNIMPSGYSGSSVTNAARLLSFFTISDIHIDDKESPADSKFLGYQGGSSSGYSGVVLYTTHVLDAAIQTINAVHKQSPFDFGISLGDDANNTQYNELRWFIDVLDGKVITPSSGAHLGSDAIDYQKPYRAAGLDKSIPWYQVVGNHDQFWSGAGFVDDRIRTTLIGENVLDIGNLLVNGGNTNSRGFYVGLIDGSKPYGDVIAVGPVDDYATPPKVTADPDRRSLVTPDSTTRSWMTEFFNTTSSPKGHGFAQSNLDDDIACYSFEPKAGVPIKVIVLDDNAKPMASPPPMHCASGTLDQKRYNWLVGELEQGQAEGKLMIVAAHIPVGLKKADGSLDASFSAASQVTESDLIAKLHGYPNLILWAAGHRHRNTVTAQPSPDPKQPELGFWEVETASLRDFPQQFRRFDIARNSDNTVSIIATSVDTAVRDGSPAAKSRTYAVAAYEIFRDALDGAPTGVFNVELVTQLSADMQAKLAKLG
jgi:metallophosphoesterase (TIGR03768 family)